MNYLSNMLIIESKTNQGMLHRISVITATYNSQDTIEDTLISVRSQNYANLEHIIIDGGSSDNTLSILDAHSEYISKIISEKDDGIYDAFNKGISIATGDIVAILNSDDIFYDNNSLRIINDEFVNKNCDIVFGDMYFFENDPEFLQRKWISSPFKLNSFKSGWHPPHPSFFVKKDVYKKYGVFNTSLKISADFELMLRFLEINRLKSSYIPKCLVLQRTGGASQKFSNILTGGANIYKAFKIHKIKFNPFWYFFKRYIFKFYYLMHSYFLKK